MRLQQYITEGNFDQGTIYKGIEDVYKNCMPFIKDLIKDGFSYFGKNDNLLYSGRKGSSKIIKKQIRKDRKPTDMPPELHEIWDDLFYDKFKMKARSNSLFCSGNVRTANGYGTPYIIFPIGQYKFIWSDKVRDLFQNDDVISMTMEWSDKYLISLNKNRTPLPRKHPINIHYAPDEWQDKYKEELNKKIISTYSNKNIMKAIRSKHEIMVSGKGYIGLEYEMFERSIKTYIDEYKTTKPTREVLDEWWERWGPLNG